MKKPLYARRSPRSRVFTRERDERLTPIQTKPEDLDGLWILDGCYSYLSVVAGSAKAARMD